MDIIQKNMGEKQAQIILDLYHEALEQNEMKISDYMQYHIFQKFDAKSMVVIVDSKMILHKSSDSKEYQSIDFIIDGKRIMIQFNPLQQYNSKGDPKLDQFQQVNNAAKGILTSSSFKVRIRMKNGTNNLNINLIMKSDHSQLLQSKREEFRFQIRKERLEDLFGVHRRINVDVSDIGPIIEIPHFSESVDLHKYLIDGEFKQQKLVKAASDVNLMARLMNSANHYDYYSILILSNICSQQNIPNIEEVFLTQLRIAQQRTDIKMIANLFNAIESLCSQQLTKIQFEYLHKNHLFQLINETLKQHLHEIYTDEELTMIQSGTGALCRFMHQFKELGEQDQVKVFSEIKYEMQHTIFLMKKFLPIQIQHPNQVFLFLKNVLQILLFDQSLVEQLDNRCLQTLVKFLDFSDNEILIVTTLRMMIYLSSLEDEKFVQRIFFLKGHDVVKQYINHESLNVRQAAIKTLANFANQSTESLQRELVSDSTFIAEVISNFSNTTKSDQDLLRLICGIIDNCMTYVSSELIQDLSVFYKVRSKFLIEDHQIMDVETLQIYQRVLLTLIVFYNAYVKDDKDFIIRIEKITQHQNNLVSEIAEAILEEINKQ